PRRQTKKRERLLFIGGGLGLLAVVGLASWLIMRGGEEVLDEPGPVVEQPAQEKEPDAPPEDPAAAARIGRIYREARAAVAAADYEAARTAFVALREDTKVQEPTRTWAAVEAVLVAFLDGKSAEARLEAEAAAAHLASADDGDPRM